MSKYKHQQELERLYSKNELMPRMRKFFTDMDAENDFDALNIDPKFGITVLVQMALHKRCNISTLVGLTLQYFKTAQEAADQIKKLIELGLVGWDDNLRVLITKFTIPPDLQAEIDKFQYPLPMVVEPRKLKSNSDTGYLVSGSHGSVILKDNHHDDDVCLDHLNRLNRIKLQINEQTAVMVNNKWKNLNKPKDGETREEFQRRVRAFEKHNKHAIEVMALVVQEGNEFYLTHRYDKRGRTYAQGHFINPQGTEYNKAVIEFVNQEVTSD